MKDVDHHLGPQMFLRGTLVFSGKAHFEGHLVGNAMGQEDDLHATLLVSPDGRIDGIVQCPVLVVGGRVNGDVTVGELIVRPGGRVVGRVQCQRMHIDQGGLVEGPVAMETSA
jgi:cytoskeletal protein CcmA (bactofilin family)